MLPAFQLQLLLCGWHVCLIELATWSWLNQDQSFLDRLTNTAPGHRPAGATLPPALITVTHSQSASMQLVLYLVSAVEHQTCQQRVALCTVRLCQRTVPRREINSQLKTGDPTELFRHTGALSLVWRTSSLVWEVPLQGPHMSQINSQLKTGGQTESFRHTGASSLVWRTSSLVWEVLHQDQVDSQLMTGGQTEEFCHTRTQHNHRPVCLMGRVPLVNCCQFIMVSHTVMQFVRTECWLYWNMCSLVRVKSFL